MTAENSPPDGGGTSNQGTKQVSFIGVEMIRFYSYDTETAGDMYIVAKVRKQKYTPVKTARILGALK